MKKLLGILVLIGVLFLPMFIAGCNEEAVTPPTNTTIDTTASEAKSILAYQVVETEMSRMINGNFSKPSDYDQLKFTNALTLYDEALVLNPNNKGARFGAALTSILSAYADAEINKLIKDMDSSFSSGPKKSAVLSNLLNIIPLPTTTGAMKFNTAAAGAGIIFSLTSVMKDPPLLSRVQQVMRNNFLPKIQKAIDHLSYIDSSETFKFVITGKMQGDPNVASVAIYPTEAALVNAMLHFLKFNIQSMLIFKFDLADYQQASLLAALNRDNTSFFVLAADGRDQAAGAKASFNTIITKMRKAIDYLQRISGNKNDAVIKLGNNGIRQADLDTMKTYLNKIESALTSEMNIELKNADSEGNTYTIRMNLGNWFNNVPVNPKKELFPAYTVRAVGTNDISIDFTATSYAEFVFPDPTFGGFFPGMTNETLKRILRIDDQFAFRMNGWVNLQPYLGYPPPANPVYTIKVYTAAQTYTTQTDNWGNYKLYVRNATATPVQVTKFAVVLNGEEYELQNIAPNTFAGIEAKEHIYAPIELILKPSGLTAYRTNSPFAIALQWNLLYTGSQYYWQNAQVVQRKTGNGTFEDVMNISPMNTLLGAFDYAISQGIQYTYRVRTYGPLEGNRYEWGDLYLVTKNIYYSNEVTITP